MHWIEVQTTLAALTVFWCNDGSVAMRMKEYLKSRLLEEIEDMRVLSNAPTGPVTCKLIEIEKPSEHLDYGHTAHHNQR